MAEDDTIELQFTRDQLRVIEQVAAAQGCTVEDYILTEALRRAREVLSAAGQLMEEES